MKQLRNTVFWLGTFILLHVCHMSKNLKKGFTLIEMLIVVVIIGILAAALIPRLQGIQGRARDTKRKADLSQIGTAAAVYKSDNGSYSGLNAPADLAPTHMTAFPTDANYAANSLSEFSNVQQGYGMHTFCPGEACLFLGAKTEVGGSSSNASGQSLSTLTTWSSVTIGSGQGLLTGLTASTADSALRYYYVQ